MKKKTLALLLTTALCLSLTLSGCSSKKEVCSVDGCSQEVYKDGLCADHYVDAALSEAAASSEAASESIDPIVAELQGKYQDYIDTAIYTLRNSLKNPKSLDIYNVYVADDSKDNGFQSVYVYVDAAAENGFGGTVRSAFYYKVISYKGDVEKTFSECQSDAEQSIFKDVAEISNGQRAADEAICLADGYYHRKFIAPKTGKEVDTGYYLHVPEAWYVNS